MKPNFAAPPLYLGYLDLYISYSEAYIIRISFSLRIFSILYFLAAALNISERMLGNFSSFLLQPS